MSQTKPLSFWQIWNMSFGFLGVQYAFGLQQANMSPIFRYLGAEESQIPLLWLAGPITGLLIQPIVGVLSDKTWVPNIGRRKPYILGGAIVTSVALVAMPYSSALWMAAALLWILDAAANVTMEPFRAMVADLLPLRQRTLGFTMQSFFVGLGQTLANLMPFLFAMLGVAVVSGQAQTDQVPDFVKYAYLVGALAILLTVGITFFSTKEQRELPNLPDASDAPKRGVWGELLHGFVNMPPTMRKLWWVKFFTWYGLPIMWQYLALSISRHCFDAPSPSDPGFEEGVRYANLGFAVFNVACLLFSFFLVRLTAAWKLQRVHAVCLTLAGIGLVAMKFFDSVPMVLGCMALVGIGWAAIMSIPYTMLSNSVPSAKMGMYMGVFNMFIVIPQIINMISMPLLYHPVLGGDPANALVLAGLSLMAGAVASERLRLPEPAAE